MLVRENGTIYRVVTRTLVKPVKFTKKQAWGHFAFSDKTSLYNEFMSDNALLRFEPFPRRGKTPRG